MAGFARVTRNIRKRVIFGHAGRSSELLRAARAQRNVGLADTSQLHLLEVFRREIFPVCCVRP